MSATNTNAGFADTTDSATAPEEIRKYKELQFIDGDTFAGVASSSRLADQMRMQPVYGLPVHAP